MERGAEGAIPPDGPTLGDLPSFAGVPAEDLRALVEAAEPGTYAAGQLILGEDEQRDGMVVIVRGSAHAYRVSLEGDEVLLAELGVGDIYGLAFVSPDVRGRSSLEAMEDGTLIYHLPREAFVQFMTAHPLVLHRAFESLANRYAMLCDRYEEVALYSVTTRTARELVREVERTGESWSDVTHAHLASRIGSKPGPVGRALQRLRKLKVIDSVPYRPGITIVDRNALAEFGRIASGEPPGPQGKE